MVPWGLGGDLVVPGDYDGDGRTDVSVFDPIDGIFYSLRSATSSVVQSSFGQNGDYPVANYDTH